ncbi:DUF2851 family protein [Carboxylicivirga sp. M1479]|uniref:DUF2851 family protein n=1 Tax=Carboxylicivirga sp. M1479 TaxID=2594476 RepID=UPI0011783E53|nr:DUF2851 family protein [Carboxylicivirga sp. M1479]TRX71388.1 DUF2851 family protein [Carboxylicivirga sp. M1479]
MNEDFLHFIWQYRLYTPQLSTTDKQSIEVIHPGTKNTDGGPDFFNAKIKIDNTLWAGNVEIHQDEKEWYAHQHHHDSTYDNVILHVIEKKGEKTVNSQNRTIPTFQMQVSNDLQSKYQQLYHNALWVPCANHISKVDKFILQQWIDRLLIERLEQKNELIKGLLQAHQNNWDQVLFILLSRSFGFGINGQPFEMMARQTPLTTLLKHADNLFQIEAILYGQAGFLSKSELNDEYIYSLRKEYKFLKLKYGLNPIKAHLWKFLRLRPGNFPTIRLAQLAMLIHKTHGQFEPLLSIDKSMQQFESLNIETSDYWTTHYKFGSTSKKISKKQLGKASQQRIVYNTILPYLFIYAAKHNNQEQKEKIIDYLYQQVNEKNATLNKWNELGVKSENEAQAQALLFLKKNYCDSKKCLNCQIGHKVLCKT